MTDAPARLCFAYVRMFSSPGADVSVHPLVMERVMHPYMFKPNTPLLPQSHASRRRDGESRSRILRLWLRSAFLNWQRRKVIATLSGLDDHQLRDIGISRSEIPNVADSLTDRESGKRPISSEEESAVHSASVFIGPSRYRCRGGL